MKKKILKIAGLIPAIVLILSGCGGSASQSNTSTATEVFEETDETGGEVSLRVWGLRKMQSFSSGKKMTMDCSSGWG